MNNQAVIKGERKHCGHMCRDICFFLTCGCFSKNKIGDEKQVKKDGTKVEDKFGPELVYSEGEEGSEFICAFHDLTTREK
jgi:hypothetical protein